MKFAILAAGEGSRLFKEGLQVPKPMVSVNGEMMIDRLIRIFRSNGADEVIVISNGRFPQIKEHLDSLPIGSFPLKVIARQTLGSMHSFYELMPLLRGSDFCLTTVDPVFREKDFSCYIKKFLQSDVDALMAVTEYVDDEKPLYVDTDPMSLQVNAFRDVPGPKGMKYVSGGIYCLRKKCLDTLERCMKQGYFRMRDFQRGLLDDRLLVQAFPFSQIIDVDHVNDIQKAEKMLREGNT